MEMLQPATPAKLSANINNRQLQLPATETLEIVGQNEVTPSEPWPVSQLVQTVHNKGRLCSITKPGGNLPLRRQLLHCPIWMLTLPGFAFPARPSALILYLAPHLASPLGFKETDLTTTKPKLVFPQLCPYSSIFSPQ